MLLISAPILCEDDDGWNPVSVSVCVCVCVCEDYDGR